VTADLAEVLKAWRKQYEAEHKVEHNKTYPYQRKMMQVSPAMSRMVELTGIRHRILYRVMALETFTTSLWMADHILTRLDLGYRLSDGSIRVLDRAHVRYNYSGFTRKFKDQEEWLEYLDQIGCRR